MKTKVITVIFKDGSLGTFENCLDVYQMSGEWCIYFKGESVKIMDVKYDAGTVACVVNGYVEQIEECL